MHVLLLWSVKLVARVLAGRYVLEKVKIVAHALRYFHMEVGEKEINSSILCCSSLHTLQMSLTCSCVVWSDTPKIVLTSYPENWNLWKCSHWLDWTHDPNPVCKITWGRHGELKRCFHHLSCEFDQAWCRGKYVRDVFLSELQLLSMLKTVNQLTIAVPLGSFPLSVIVFAHYFGLDPSPLSDLFHWNINSKGILGDLLGCCFPAISCQKLRILALVCFFCVCSLAANWRLNCTNEQLHFQNCFCRERKNWTQGKIWTEYFHSASASATWC